MARPRAQGKTEAQSGSEGAPVATADPTSAKRAARAPRGRAGLPWITYRFRLVGMGLGGLSIGAVLHENGVAWPVWGLLAFTALLWPHLALQVATRSASPYHAERRNLLLDSAQTGFWVAMMQFNLLPSVLLFTLVTVDKISTGIPRLWLWSLPAFAAGVLGGGLVTGFALRPDTSMTVVLFSLPALSIHTIGVALAVGHMGQKIRHKNRQLDELSRTDSLTGLYVRRHWLELAERALRRHRDTRAPMGLLLLDIDHFKIANDRHGHSVGDEVLRAVAGAIRTTLHAPHAAGRYGGDEFGVLLPDTTEEQARALAEAILTAIRDAGIGVMPGARITASIGIAMAQAGHATVEQWIDEADAALYRAKRAGRDRIGG
jgi:diguanylate cyclase